MVLIPVAGIRHDYFIDPSDGRVFPVLDLVVTANDESTVTVQFTEIDDGLGNPADYGVYVREKGTGVWVVPGDETLGKIIGATATVVVPNLNPGTTWEIMVRGSAGAALGLAYYSNIVERATDASVPAQPTALVTTAVSPTQVDLSCTDNGGTGFSWSEIDPHWQLWLGEQYHGYDPMRRFKQGTTEATQ